MAGDIQFPSLPALSCCHIDYFFARFKKYPQRGIADILYLLSF